MKNNLRPKQLDIQPLSIAKFFYEKLGERGAEQIFLQPIVYLIHQEIRKKERCLLFKEEFTLGIANPILPSLTNLIKKHGDHLDDFFSQIPDINNFHILSYLEKFAKKYANSLSCEIQYQAQKKSGITV